MVYLKVIQKITPMDISVSGTIDQETYLKKFRGPSVPLDPPMNKISIKRKKLPCKKFAPCDKS